MATAFSNPQQYGNWQTYAGYSNPETGTYTFGQKPSSIKPKAPVVMGSPIPPPTVMDKTDYSVKPINTTQFGIPFQSFADQFSPLCRLFCQESRYQSDRRLDVQSCP